MAAIAVEVNEGLRIPGPVPLHPQVQAALQRPMMSYRGPAMRELLARVKAGLAELVGSRSEPLLLTGSGTGAMEAAVVNTLAPGDRVVSLGGGQFAERFRDLARAFGLECEELGTRWGEPADPDELRYVLRNKPARAVLLTHCETSTGVLHPLEELMRVAREEGNPLTLVDAVSSLGAAPVEVDACDVVFTGSQKAWGLPPGMAMVWTSNRWCESGSLLPRFYWDFDHYRREVPPFTPALSVLFAMETGVRLMLEEGPAQVRERHQRAAAFVRGALDGVGLRVVAPPGFQSPTVTAAWLPDGVSWDALSARLAERGVTLGGGLGRWAGKILRVGHLGWMTAEDLRPALAALADAVGGNGAQS